RLNSDGVLFRFEAPRKTGMDIGVEADSDLSGYGAGCAVRALGSAVPAGRLAKCRVELGSESHEKGHGGDDRQEDYQRLAVSVFSDCGVHQLIPVFAMVMKNKSTTKAPSNQPKIRERSR